MLHPGVILATAVVVLGLATWRRRTPLPLALIVVSVLAAALAGYGFPFRHLVEGGFGYINLALGLFAGAFFGQMMRISGAAEAVAARVDAGLNGNPWAILSFAGALLFLVGMFVGIAGIAVLATGVFVVPQLRRLGLAAHDIGAFVAVVATCGMIAPPVNVPAMSIADGVNMPYSGFGLPLLVLSLPPALVALALAAVRRGATPPPQTAAAEDGFAATIGFLALFFVLGFWTLLRLFPTAIPDPAAPIILVIGGLIALPLMTGVRLRDALAASLSGTPLVLAAVLVTVGIAVQIMTLTGIRGFVVINAMGLPPPWILLELVLMPVLGGVLTSIGTANVLGVPFAFALIGQDMILNSAALSAIAALSEFVPPTAIAAALATYVVGDTSLSRVIRAALGPVVVIAALAILMLVFADTLASLLSTSGIGPRDH